MTNIATTNRYPFPIMDPVWEGYHAFNRGDLINPHILTSDEGKEWQRGWNKGYFANQRKRVLNRWRGYTK